MAVTALQLVADVGHLGARIGPRRTHLLGGATQGACTALVPLSHTDAVAAVCTVTTVHGSRIEALAALTHERTHGTSSGAGCHAQGEQLLINQYSGVVDVVRHS